MWEIFTNSWLYLLIILFAGLLFGEAENILMYRFSNNWKIKPMFLGHWYIYGKHTYQNKLVHLLMKYVFAAFKSGFHLLKTVSIILFIIGISGLDIGLFWKVVVTYGIYGTGFNIGYHY